MPENNRGIGSEGLEQGGPNLGNDFARKDLSVGKAGDAFTTPASMSASNDNDTDDRETDDDDLGDDDILEDDELGEDDELPEDDELGDDDEDDDEEDKNL